MRRFTDIKQRLTQRGKRYYINTVLPDVPLSSDDVYIIKYDKNRLDNLSYEFYNDTQFWWVILAANPNKLRKDSYHVALGEQIRIPANPSQYTNSFINFNNNNR